MKFLVTVKRVIDYETKLKIRDDSSDVEREGVNMIMNPFDQIAVEEALRQKEKHGGEVVIISIGSKDCEAQIRAALAMGAERGILVEHELDLSQDFDSRLTAKILHKIIKQENPDIVFMGKQSIDDDNHQTAEMLAEMWGVGQATQANTVNINNSVVEVIREADGGLETIQVDMPCIITSDLRLNEPRYTPLPGIMKAKRKPLDIINFGDLGISHENQIRMSKLSYPPSRASGQIVDSVSVLVDKLKNEAKVLF